MICQLKGQDACCLFCALLFLINRKLSGSSDATVKDFWCNACAGKMYNSAIVSPIPSPSFAFYHSCTLKYSSTQPAYILTHKGLCRGRNIDFSIMCRSNFSLLEFCAIARYTEIQIPALTTFL